MSRVVVCRKCGYSKPLRDAGAFRCPDCGLVEFKVVLKR